MPLSLFALLAAAATINTMPADAISHYARATATSDPSELAEAFQPSAIMYCTAGGALTATYQAQWKARMAGASPPKPASTETEWLDVGRTTALARLRSVRGDKIYTDYLLLARLDKGWRIVGKVCAPAGKEGSDVRAASTGSLRPSFVPIVVGTMICSAAASMLVRW